MGIISSTLFYSIRAYGACHALLCSYRALREPGCAAAAGVSAEHQRLLRQWSVLAFLGLWECSLEPLCAWAPFYSILKLLVHILAVAPGVDGAGLLFSGVLRPALLGAGARLSARAAPLLVRAFGAVCARTAALARTPAEADAWAAALREQRGRAARELHQRGEPERELLDEEELRGGCGEGALETPLDAGAEGGGGASSAGALRRRRPALAS